MATKISIANIARVSAGVVAIMWALLGLSTALAGWGHSIDALVAAATLVNVALIGTAVLAFRNARNWRAAMVFAITAVTVERIVYVLGTGDYLSVLISASMLVAIVGITFVAHSR